MSRRALAGGVRGFARSSLASAWLVGCGRESGRAHALGDATGAAAVEEEEGDATRAMEEAAVAAAAHEARALERRRQQKLKEKRAALDAQLAEAASHTAEQVAALKAEHRCIREGVGWGGGDGKGDGGGGSCVCVWGGWRR